jgi:hypothetical protein
VPGAALPTAQGVPVTFALPKKATNDAVQAAAAILAAVADGDLTSGEGAQPWS